MQDSSNKFLITITSFVIQLEKKKLSTELTYISDESRLPVYLKLKGNPVFEYQSNEGVWLSSWPQIDDEIRGISANDLPKAIRLKDGDSDAVFLLLIPGRHRDLPEQLGFIR